MSFLVSYSTENLNLRGFSKYLNIFMCSKFEHLYENMCNLLVESTTVVLIIHYSKSRPHDN